MATLTTAYSTPHVHQQYMDNAQATNALLADDASFADQAHGEEEEYINTFFVRALYDYQSDDPISLSFKKRDIIEVLSRLESGWWDGLLNDERGWFPSNYVEVINAQEADSINRESTYSSSIAPSDSGESVVDMASVMANGQNDEWMDDSTADLRNALGAAAQAQPPALTSSADFWVPNVGADGQVYYVNTQTGERSRDLPLEADDDIGDGDLAGLSPQQPSSRSGTSMGLGYNHPADPRSISGAVAGFGVQTSSNAPEPWKRRLADDGLSYYYVNTLTGETRWTLPDAGPPGTNGATTPVRREDNISLSSMSSSQAPNGFDMYNSLRSDSALSENRETSVGDGTSIYSDDSDVQPRLSERAAVTNPLQRSIAQARQDGTLELTTAEQAAQALQQAMSPAPPPTIVELSSIVQDALTTVVDGSHGADLSQPAQAEVIYQTVGLVVSSIRDLLYVTTLPSGPVPEDTPDGEEARTHLHAQLKPTQRKVTATLSKLVLSVHALQYDTDSGLDGAAQKIESDAVELKGAIQAFVLDVQRYHRHSPLGAKRVRGTFSTDNLGLGLLGSGAAGSWKGFGYVPLDQTTGVPSKELGSDIVVELKAMANQLRKELNSFNIVLKSPTRGLASKVAGHSRDVIRDFSEFLAFVANICVARHVDIDGIQREPGQTTVHEMYMQAVHNARQHVRMLEVAVQAIYDDSASLLTTTQALRQADLNNYEQSEKDRAACYARLLALVNTMEANTKVVERTLETILQVGLDQADLALGDYNGSIGWRLSRVSVIESTLRPMLVTPSTARGFDRESVVDMAHALGKTRTPAAYADHGSEGSQSGSEMPPTPTWESGGQSSEDLHEPMSPVDSATALLDDDVEGASDDDELKGPSSSKTPRRGNKLFQVLGAEAPSHYIKTLNADATPWYLKPDYNPSDIVMDPKDGTVKAGTIQALVERLTSHENPDTKFIKTFLMTWKSFTTIEELFALLTTRYWIEPPEGLKPNELEDWGKLKQHVVRTRILNTFKTMVMDDDDVLDGEDHAIFSPLREFVTHPRVEHLAAAKQTLVWIERTQNGEGKLQRTGGTQGSPPAPVIPRSLNLKKPKLMDCDPLELARQLTLQESSHFLKIKPMECILRSREQRSGKEDNIAAIINMTNRLSNWVADTVLSKEDSKRRAAIVKFWIMVADHCRKLNNFSTMIAIVSGLNNPASRRLKRTWEQVSQRSLAQLQECDGTMDTNKNFNHYRSILAKVTPPCVPFFGLYLTQLTFIQDGNPDMVDGKINFGKRHRAAEVINDIKRWQTRTYNLTEIEQLAKFILESLDQYTDPERLKDELWNLSLEREPREREDEKMARLLQESGFL